jgi:adenine-specific DNA-methyltransferase
LKNNYSIYLGTADLSIYFVELAFRLLSVKGYAYYITTNKFFNTGYGKKVRELLAQKNIRTLLNFEQVEVFENVLVSSVILGCQNRELLNNNSITYEQFYKLKYKEFKSEFINRLNELGCYPQNYLDSAEWSFADTSGLMLREHIKQNSTNLSDINGINIYRGVTTGYNPAFIIDNEKRDELILADSHNIAIIKNMLQGRNIRKWFYNESNENLIFTRRGCIIDNYPLLKEHLSQFYNQLKPKISSTDLEGRKPGKYKWFEILDNTAYYQEFEKSEKIIWGLTADKWAFAYDGNQHFLPSNGYILTSSNIPIKYILGVLNSKLMKHYFGYIGVMTAGGAYTLKAASISSLPFKVAINASPLVNIVDSILKIKKTDKNADISVQERMIDSFVYKLYGLSDEEIKIIERGH